MQPCTDLPLQHTESVNPVIRDAFGYTIEANDDWLFVGEPFRKDSPGVHIYRATQSGWERSQFIDNPQSDNESDFGVWFSLDGARVAIGAPTENDFGVVYFYTNVDGQWVPEHEYVVEKLGDSDSFISIDLDGDTIALGYPNRSESVTIAQLSNGQWSAVQEIWSPKSPFFTAYFGSRVVLRGDELAIADYGQLDEDYYESVGAVHFYKRINGDWVLQQELNADRRIDFSDLEFGRGLDFNEHSLVIGSRYDNDFGEHHGAVHFYKRRASDGSARTSGPWERIDKKYPQEIDSQRALGWQVALDKQTAVVTALSEFEYDAQFDDTVFFTKSRATIFARQGESWFHRDTIEHPDGHAGDFFGWSLDVVNDQLFVANPFTERLDSSGEVLICDISCLDDVCIGDLNADGAVNFFDVSMFLEAYLSDNEIADLNQDGDLNFLDVSTLLDAYAGGC